jgi:hypothetical protein
VTGIAVVVIAGALATPTLFGFNVGLAALCVNAAVLAATTTVASRARVVGGART